jgi:predicted dehydrogenase
MNDKKVTRRGFLGAATAAGVFTIAPRHVLGGPKHKAPSDRLNIAGIGIGGKGGGDLAAVESENIVALCDVDLDYATRIIKKYPKARVYQDYRRLLDEGKDIDGVMVATPDHTHAVISLAAMNADKHIFCQKPMAHDVYEARLLAKTAKETGLATQMGIQGHSKEGSRLICEWIWDGAIGEIHEVDVWCSLTYYPWGHEGWSSPWGGKRPTETPPVPPKLAWDLWLGPAPTRAYHPAYHPKIWRCWWDYGSGMMGDRGVHTLDPVFWAMKLDAPKTIEATSTGLNPDTHPLASIVTYEFDARADMPPVTIKWFDGIVPPRPEGVANDVDLGDNQGGIVFKGTKGMLTCGRYGGNPRLLPEQLMKEYKRPPQTIPRIAHPHAVGWVKACKGGPPAMAEFGYAGPLNEMCCLGNVAKRVEGRLEWDAENLRVTNNPEANRYIRKEYRKGWSLS